MTYREALAYLASIEGLGIKLALQNITAVLRALGDPQRSFRSVLVAGSNGKGSAAAMLESILRAAGHRTGLYTSPHLTRYEERILLDGRPVSPEPFGAAVGGVAEESRRLLERGDLEAHPTHFETVTAAAFLLLSGRVAGRESAPAAGAAGGGSHGGGSREGMRSPGDPSGGDGRQRLPAAGAAGGPRSRSGSAPVDVAVLEVGMGGRLDATVLAGPALSLITNVSLEHTRYLGSDVASIAREKAGVLVEGGTLLAGETHPDALAAFRERARETGGRLVELDRWARLGPAARGEGAGGAAGAELPVRGEPGETVRPVQKEIGSVVPRARQAAGGTAGERPPDRTGGGPFGVTTGRRGHAELRLALAGDHQVRNAVLAVAAADLLDEMGVSVPAEAVRQGLASARWPGRFQVVEGAPRLILDGAHNPAACRALRETLAAGGFAPRDTTLLLGILRDKDAESMLREILPAAGRVVTTRGLSPRFRDPWALAGAVGRRFPAVEAAGDLPEGLARAREITPPDGAVCVTGSLYLVGDLMAHLGMDPFAAPAPPDPDPSPRS